MPISVKAVEVTFQSTTKELLAKRLEVAFGGVEPTAIEGIRLFWTVKPTPPEPLVYEAGLTILLNGRKEGTLGDRSFIYDAANYLVLTLPMPFLCAHQASNDEPVCGLFISASREDLSLLLGQMADYAPVEPQAGLSALAPAPLTEAMQATMMRLVSAIGDPVAARVIGPALRREILFHALRGPRGPALAAYAQQTGDDGLLDGLIEDIRLNIAKPVTIEAMADRVAMSVSTFHRAFRRRTGQTPVQYIKRLRLHMARDLITFEGARIKEAARRVGYESTSQFSREYKRHFNVAASVARDFSATAPASEDALTDT
ncbi:AraC family transcriptional regulator [Asticcacaulis sp. BYS171W]|uniref:AraC family transcriptional regulator n=1 Tax=Asticcacaulis aquaticus TaxID=2984212 RepID=A0ABT5HWE0_9CAUL|nr:AraC family transcriptional regulator [Asticcacaulis aquaticus]MDC7683751.1 AraC family transcriptional regulator [Asticcacaulis aquaticus]